MKTTIDLPEDLLVKTKIVAAQRHTTIKKLIIQGLETVLTEGNPRNPPAGALARLRKGYDLGGKPLTRDEIYDR